MERKMPKDHSVLDEIRECAASDPRRALELGNLYIENNPLDSNGYFSRHLTWARLGNHQNALTDCSAAIGILPKPNRYMARAEIYRALGDHTRALADLNHAHDLDRETWLTSFGPHLRSDTLARLGRLDEALSDTALIPDNHWMPEHDGLPGGNKQEFIAELKRRARGAGWRTCS
jgi:tetratricopeptide (TPR) repeat protein